MAATKKAVDFTNVKEGGAFQPRRVPAGEYRATIVSVDDHYKGEEKTSTQWVFGIRLAGKRSLYPYYVSHTEAKQAWKIRNLCLAAGIPVPKKRVAVDPNKLVNKEIGVEMEDDEYDGKEKSTIAATFPASDLSGDTPVSSKKASSSSKKSNDVDEDDDDEDMDELDLEEV